MKKRRVVWVVFNRSNGRVQSVYDKKKSMLHIYRGADYDFEMTRFIESPLRKRKTARKK